MTQPTPAHHKDHCRVCRLEKEIRWSMSLEKVDGQWKSVPVCDKCRGLLIREAKTEGRFIPFFSWDASQKEAAKRNEQSKVVRVFVGRFGRKRDDKSNVLRDKLSRIAVVK